MVPIAHGGLRHLRNQRLGIAQRQMLQLTAQRVAAYYWWIFPNLMFNFYP
jgi:hypothetical protein